MNTGRIDAESLRRFKSVETDENDTIAKLVTRMMPNDTPFVIDVGAGLGDIAVRSFPDIDALLIDIADFPTTICKKHRRETADFFDYPYLGPPGGTMLFSHVLQYLDDDVDRLVQKTLEYRPKYILVVCDIVDNFQEEIFQWLRDRNIEFNPEIPLPGFPGERFRRLERIEFSGQIRTESFADLADRLSRIIFDAAISTMQSRELGRWLQGRLTTPSVSIPQSIELFESVKGGGYV